MGRCDVCGNDYDKMLVIAAPERSGTFDSFECALHALAPICEHCGCRIIGHGVEGPGGALLLLRQLRRHGGHPRESGQRLAGY